MTYCAALSLKEGLVFMSDTRTNAGLDNISVFKKMFHWTAAGDRSITLLTAGNLATTQAVVSLLDERTKAPGERTPSILEAPSMFQVARIVGETLREVIADHADEGQKADAAFNGTLILGGQVKGSEPRLFLIYPEGNFIEAGSDTPFLQIGETKYGKPILVRAYDPEMSFDEAIKLLLLSFDSTIKANLGVDLPLDAACYTAGSLAAPKQLRITAKDPYFQTISSGWGDALKQAFKSLPDFEMPD